MKAKLLTILAAVAVLLTSCNMDLAPEGALEESTAIQSLNDAQRFRNGFYSSMRSLATSKFFTYSDIQTDKFAGIVINGNRMGTIANGDVLASDGDISGYWLALYGMIANVNYYLSVMEPLLEQAQADQDPQKLELYPLFIGEAHFFRGYYYAMMFDRWCTVYSPEKGDTPALGLPIVTVYAPTADRSKYPGRSTMNETIKFIKNEFDLALKALLDYEEVDNSSLAPNAVYLSSCAVKAMQARLALWLGEYNDALALSEEVIDSGYYMLAALNNYGNLWTQDTSTEVIFRTFMRSPGELSNSIGGCWIGTQITDADYIPTQACIDSYLESGVYQINKVKDVRYGAFLKDRVLATAYGDIKTTCFNKFPGNSTLQTSSVVNLMNMAKPFRLSEMYLIAAESAYMLHKEDVANQYLNTFCSFRINQYANRELSGDALRDAIRSERGKELIGEGFRMSDLRRWRIGFERKSACNFKATDVNLIVTKASLNVVYTPDDHRYTWPIPSDELQSNPQIANQQNPGY